MRRLIFLTLIIAFSAIYYFSSHDETSFLHQTISDVKKLVKISPFSGGASAAVPATGRETGAPFATNSSPEVSEIPGLNPEQLEAWIRHEAARMNLTTNDTEEQQKKLKAQAQVLTAEQLENIKEIAVSTSQPVNDRIFSSYLLTLNTSDSSPDNMFEVARTAVPDFGPVLPHSEAEVRHGQELALRFMQIDELFQRAKTDPNAADKLKLLVTEAESAQVRSYAEKKLKELSL